MKDLTLTFPCPICEPRVMLTAQYEPGEHPADRPFLVTISGCLHARAAQSDLDGRPIPPCVPRAFWRAVFVAAEEWARDRYTDALEQSAKYRHLREEE